jgi:hypothetical protein
MLGVGVRLRLAAMAAVLAEVWVELRVTGLHAGDRHAQLMADVAGCHRVRRRGGRIDGVAIAQPLVAEADAIVQVPVTAVSVLPKTRRPRWSVSG